MKPKKEFESENQKIEQIWRSLIYKHRIVKRNKQENIQRSIWRTLKDIRSPLSITHEERGRKIRSCKSIPKFINCLQTLKPRHSKHQKPWYFSLFTSVRTSNPYPILKYAIRVLKSWITIHLQMLQEIRTSEDNIRLDFNEMLTRFQKESSGDWYFSRGGYYLSLSPDKRWLWLWLGFLYFLKPGFLTTRLIDFPSLSLLKPNQTTFRAKQASNHFGGVIRLLLDIDKTDPIQLPILNRKFYYLIHRGLGSNLFGPTSMKMNSSVHSLG